MYRIFIAHARACDGPVLDALMVEVNKAVAEKLKGYEYAITLGRDDYQANIAACGNWNGWITRVATGVHPVTREPLYNAILVIPVEPNSLRCGKATAQIVQTAHQAGREVRVWHEGKIWKVDGFNEKECDKRDMQSGYKLDIKP